MPLTHFQREVLAVIVSNRSEASHFAGGLVLNAADGSPRFSKDFDFFHDAVEALADASERDAAALRAAGFEVIPNEKYGDWTTLSSFRRADVRRGTEETVSLDWAHDSAWRFFPIVPDPVLGWRLHLFDMPIGVAFVDERGEPGWIGRDPTLRIHRLSLRGCWPAMQGQSAAGA
jgi:hypothetical protein